MKKLLVGLLLAAASTPSSAAIIHFNLRGVTFDDGGTATGGFDYDTVTTRVVNLDLTTTGGSVEPGSRYTALTSTGGAIGFGSGDDSGWSYLQLINAGFAAFPMSGTVALATDGVFSYENYLNVRRFVTAGEITTEVVPEPAMLALFGLGVVALALSRRRIA